MSGQDFSDPMGPATVITGVMSPAQIRLDNAVGWIFAKRCADKVLSITTIGRPSIHLDSIGLLRRLLAGSGVTVYFSDGGKRAQATFDGIEIVALDSDASSRQTWEEIL